MALTLGRIQEAKKRIEPYVVETPLVRLRNLDEYLGCKVYAKLECMQVTSSFKLRGAMNKILRLDDGQLQRGIVAASSGNHGKALAYASHLLGVKAIIVLPYTVAEAKADMIRAWGAEIVQCDVSERFEVAERLSCEYGATLVPPYNDEDVMAGQGTAGLEIMAQQPDLDAIVVPVSGGGLIGGVSTAVKAVSSETKVYGAEPGVLPRYTASLAAGHPVMVEKHGTVADALPTQMPGELCYPYVEANVEAIADVDETYILKGMKLILTEGKILCEPSSGIGAGAILQGLLPVKAAEKVCLFISGGSVSLGQLRQLEDIEL